MDVLVEGQPIDITQSHVLTRRYRVSWGFSRLVSESHREEVFIVL